jgi:hypothetical protein
MGSSEYFAPSSPPPSVWYAGPKELTIENLPVETPYFSVASQMESLERHSLPKDFQNRLEQLNMTPPNFYHVRLEISHRPEVRWLALLGILVMFIQPVILWRLVKNRKFVGNSNYLQMCLGFLLFLPILILTFRTTIAPSWITILDLLDVFFVLVWAIVLVARVNSYSRMCSVDDS